MELPSGFGKTVNKAELQTEYENRLQATKRKETSPPPLASTSRTTLQGEEEEDENAGLDLPISHEAQLKDHQKTVSALSIDPAGARVCTGSYDYHVKLWDFGGMDSAFRPFRSWEPVPEGSYQVNDVKWSNSGDRILVASATNQIKLFGRDAEEICIFPKGDMYLRDLKNTAGHIAEITQCAWHPKEENTFITCSHDSTVRIWDSTKRDKSKQVIVVKSKERGQRTHITACCYSQDAKWIAAAGLDGCIYVWATNSNFVRPNYSVENAHVKGTIISSLTFSLDNRTLLSRGTDGSVKMWDIKALKKPIAVNSNLPNRNAECNVIFSPDENFILSGTAGHAFIAGEKKIEAANGAANVDGQLVIMNRSDLSVYKSINISEGNVVKVLWHPKINQIFASTSLGTVHILYSPETSLKGATMSLTRVARRREQAEDSLPTPDQIHLPDALPMFKDNVIDRALGARRGKRKQELEKERKGPQENPPEAGPGTGGRIGASATQHLVQGLVYNKSRDEDPREALLKYADQADKDKLWTKIYSETQPKPVFDYKPPAQEFDETGKLIEPEAKKRKTEGLQRPKWFGGR